jgi:hypothetical protein
VLGPDLAKGDVGGGGEDDGAANPGSNVRDLPEGGVPDNCDPDQPGEIEGQDGGHVGLLEGLGEGEMAQAAQERPMAISQGQCGRRCAPVAGLRPHQPVDPGGYVLFEATHNLYDESSPVTFPTIRLGC